MSEPMQTQGTQRANAIGASIPQLDGDEKLTGRAQYIADLYRPGMLHGAIRQSPHAHARIRGYDLSAAKAETLEAFISSCSTSVASSG